MFKNNAKGKVTFGAHDEKWSSRNCLKRNKKGSLVSLLNYFIERRISMRINEVKIISYLTFRINS